MLTRTQFEILKALATRTITSQRQLADSCGFSLGSVNKAYRALVEEGAVHDDFQLTSQGLSALKPYKVDNAIIMAAGLSSRFAPISYEKPKGLLKVRGEVLIERQIEQLIEAGIPDITIVVGYKKEYFFYLEHKHNVRIVINDEYATRNNNGSLYRVKEQLGNTYICSSDDYFTENPFDLYVWKAYYAAQYSEGHTEEWCMETGAKNRIVSVSVGGSNAYYMLGQAYFDNDFSSRFRQILEEEYSLPETTDKLWEELFTDHIKELDMELKPYAPGVINEFDSLDELRSFDPHFLENVDSEIFDNISSVLGCSKEEIHDVYPLKQGITNLSCHFAVDSGEYVYRHPGIGTELLIDRKAEVAALKTGKALGLDETFVFEDPEQGWKISRYLPKCKPFDPHNHDHVAKTMRMAFSLHASDATVSRTFDFYEEARRYENLLGEKKALDIPGFREMSEKVSQLNACVKKDRAPICLCHNDLSHLNVLIDEDDQYYLIDWEYAGMSDYANDFGTFCVSSQLNEREAYKALESYFGRKPTAEEIRHNFAHIQLAGWCWYLWSLLKEAEGDSVGEMLYVYYSYASEFLDPVLEMYKGE